MSGENITSQHVASMAAAILDYFKAHGPHSVEDLQIESLAGSALSQARDGKKHTSNEIASLAGHVLKNASHFAAPVRSIAASVLEQAKR
jgi:hypothetical protein